MVKRKRNDAAAGGQEPLRRSARLIEKQQAQAQAQAQTHAQQANSQGANNQQVNNHGQAPQAQQQPQQQQPEQQPQGQPQQHQQQLQEQLQQHLQQQQEPRPQPQPQQQIQQLPQQAQPNQNTLGGAALGSEQARVQEVRNSEAKKIRRTRNNPRIQYWRAHNQWPPKTPEERFALIDPNRIPDSIRRSSMSDWAREREDADWAVQEERERSPERGDGAYNFANCTGFLDFYEMHTRDHQAGVPEVVQALCRDLLEKDAETPRDTVFEVKTFPKTCERLLMKDPSGVNRLIGELVVPSAETARDRGLTEFDHYSVSMGDVWKWMLPLIENEREEMRRPQPDYAVGFLADAFTEEQLRKMEPYSGIESYFRCTASMYFPFLTTEIATSKPLDMADVENTYSAGLGAGGVVGLFREAKREEELHEQVVAFSISHSHCAVRIYAHYVMVDDGKVSYYRHLVREYELTPADIEDRWTSYKFALALYSNWAPEYHRRLCSAIDDLPDPPELDTPN